MASLADQYTYSQNAVFQSKVKQQMVASAIAIAGEAQAFDRDRRALAVRVLASGGVTAYLSVFVAAVSNDTTVSGKIASGGASGAETDTDITNAISAAWNAIANQG